MPQFIPHGVCLNWNTNLLALNVIADSLVALAYFLIPFALFKFGYRLNVRYETLDPQFRPVTTLFILFIFLCGSGHLIDVILIWKPWYWLKGWWTLGTALSSIMTAAVLFRLNFTTSVSH